VLTFRRASVFVTLRPCAFSFSTWSRASASRRIATRGPFPDRKTLWSPSSVGYVESDECLPGTGHTSYKANRFEVAVTRSANDVVDRVSRSADVGFVCFVTCDVIHRVAFVKRESGFDDCWCGAVATAFPFMSVDLGIVCREAQNTIDYFIKLRDSAGDWREYLVIRQRSSGRGSS